MRVMLDNHSQETVLVTLTVSLWRHVDPRGSVLLLLLDLLAVFNTGSYDLMTHCLADIGVQGPALQ